MLVYCQLNVSFWVVAGTDGDCMVEPASRVRAEDELGLFVSSSFVIVVANGGYSFHLSSSCSRTSLLLHLWPCC